MPRLYEILGYYGSGYRIIAGAGVKHNLLLVLAPERVRHSSVQLDLRRRCAWPAWHQPRAMGTSQHMHEGEGEGANLFEGAGLANASRSNGWIQGAR